MVGTKDLTERNNCKDTELKLGLNEMEEGLSKDFCFFAPQSFSPLSWKSILVTERGGTFLLTRACNACFSYTVQSIKLGSVQTCLTKSRRQWQYQLITIISTYIFRKILFFSYSTVNRKLQRGNIKDFLFRLNLTFFPPTGDFLPRTIASTRSTDFRYISFRSRAELLSFLLAPQRFAIEN